jgi:hypothetical protein
LYSLREEVVCLGLDAFSRQVLVTAASVVASRRFWNAVSDQYLRFVCVCRFGARRI